MTQKGSESDKIPHTILRKKSTTLTIILIAIVSAGLIGIVLAIHFLKGVSIRELTADPTSIFGGAPYIGFLSQIGIFFWASAAAICYFSAVVLFNRRENHKFRNFLLVSGLLTSLLGFDDIFLLHETVFPHLGIPEKVIYAGYGSFMLFYLIKFYPMILKTQYIFLGLALAFFATSISLDVFNLLGVDEYLFEDGTKLIGILCWFAYFFHTNLSAVESKTEFSLRNI